MPIEGLREGGEKEEMEEEEVGDYGTTQKVMARVLSLPMRTKISGIGVCYFASFLALSFVMSGSGTRQGGMVVNWTPAGGIPRFASDAGLSEEILEAWLNGPFGLRAFHEDLVIDRRIVDDAEYARWLSAASEAYLTDEAFIKPPIGTLGDYLTAIFEVHSETADPDRPEYRYLVAQVGHYLPPANGRSKNFNHWVGWNGFDSKGRLVGGGGGGPGMEVDAPWRNHIQVQIEVLPDNPQLGPEVPRQARYTAVIDTGLDDNPYQDVTNLTIQLWHSTEYVGLIGNLSWNITGYRVAPGSSQTYNHTQEIPKELMVYDNTSYEVISLATQYPLRHPGTACYIQFEVGPREE